jgi:hypothetical protein
VSPVKYEIGSYIPEDAILHSHRRENLKSCIFCRYLSIATLQKIKRKLVLVLN